MSDERLRVLERRWRESGRLTDRLTWLSAQARAGRLAPDVRELVRALDEGGCALDRLALLAYLGVPAAGELLGDERVELASYLGDLGAVRVVLGEEHDREDEIAWAHGLAHWPGPEVCRALAEITLRAATVLAAEDVPPDPDDEYGYERETRAAERARAPALAEARLRPILMGAPGPPPRPTPDHWLDPRVARLDAALDALLAAWPERIAVRRGDRFARWAPAAADAADRPLSELVTQVAARLIGPLEAP